MPAPVTALAPPVTGSTPFNIASSTTSQQFSPANGNRKGWWVYNDSSANLLLMMAALPASTTSYSVKVASQGFFELPQPYWLGAINGVWDAVAGTARVMDFY